MMKEVLKCPYEASIGILYPFGGFINSSATPACLERRDRFGNSESSMMVMLLVNKWWLTDSFPIL